MQKRIACLDLDAFFVEAALKLRPDLRGRAMAVGGTGNRGVICSASYEARRFGVCSAMPLWLARSKCAELVLLPVPDNISELSQAVRRRLEEFCPVVEQASVDEFYLDFTGCDRIYPTNLAIADRIMHAVRSVPGLPATIGIGTNKLVCKIASNLGKPAGILEILPGSECAFLSHLPVGEIPGIGSQMQRVLNSMGVYYVSDILTMPVEAWRAAFGRTGDYIFNAARGICESEVTPPENKPQRKGISRDITLSEDTSSRLQLADQLSYLVESAVYRLQNERLTCGNLTLKLRYADFVTRTASKMLPRTNDDRDIYKVAVALLQQLFQRRVAVRLIGVHLGSLQPGGVTPDLFDILQPEHKRQLPEVLKIIRARYGFDAILRSRSVRMQGRAEH
ncbi:MAG TPA: DNA polymerase IV [Candidatus Rifleibacterium sp.]|nr:DNA polymerase IV [Candidatus Rifleibacterium sp.]HPT45084.1 DNA polymerase IV [Candidatus Rifleibacterium sp.]